MLWRVFSVDRSPLKRCHASTHRCFVCSRCLFVEIFVMFVVLPKLLLCQVVAAIWHGTLTDCFCLIARAFYPVQTCDIKL